MKKRFLAVLLVSSFVLGTASPSWGEETHMDTPNIQEEEQSTKKTLVTQAYAAGHAKGFAAGLAHANKVLKETANLARHPHAQHMWYKRALGWAQLKYDTLRQSTNAWMAKGEDQIKATYNATKGKIKNTYDEAMSYVKKTF